MKRKALAPEENPFEQVSAEHLVEQAQAKSSRQALKENLYAIRDANREVAARLKAAAMVPPTPPPTYVPKFPGRRHIPNTPQGPPPPPPSAVQAAASTTSVPEARVPLTAFKAAPIPPPTQVKEELDEDWSPSALIQLAKAPAAPTPAQIAAATEHGMIIDLVEDEAGKVLTKELVDVMKSHGLDAQSTQEETEKVMTEVAHVALRQSQAYATKRRREFYGLSESSSTVQAVAGPPPKRQSVEEQTASSSRETVGTIAPPAQLVSTVQAVAPTLTREHAPLKTVTVPTSQETLEEEIQVAAAVAALPVLPPSEEPPESPPPPADVLPPVPPPPLEEPPEEPQPPLEEAPEELPYEIDLFGSLPSDFKEEIARFRIMHDLYTELLKTLDQAGQEEDTIQICKENVEDLLNIQEREDEKSRPSNSIVQTIALSHFFKECVALEMLFSDLQRTLEKRLPETPSRTVQAVASTSVSPIVPSAAPPATTPIIVKAAPAELKRQAREDAEKFTEANRAYLAKIIREAVEEQSQQPTVAASLGPSSVQAEAEKKDTKSSDTQWPAMQRFPTSEEEWRRVPETRRQVLEHRWRKFSSEKWTPLPSFRSNVPPRISHRSCHILRHKFANKRETNLHAQWIQSDEGVMKWPDFVKELNSEIKKASKGWTDFTSDRSVVRFLMRTGGGKPRFMMRFGEETQKILDKTPLQGIEADLDPKSSVQADAWWRNFRTPLEIACVQGFGGTLESTIGSLPVHPTLHGFSPKPVHFSLYRHTSSILFNGLLAGGLQGQGSRNQVYMSIKPDLKLDPNYNPPYITKAQVRNVAYPPSEKWEIAVYIDYPLLVTCIGQCLQTLSAALITPCGLGVPPQCIYKIVHRKGHVLYKRPPKGYVGAPALGLGSVQAGASGDSSSADPTSTSTVQAVAGTRSKCPKCRHTYVPGTTWCLSCDAKLPEADTEASQAERPVDSDLADTFQAMQLSVRTYGTEAVGFRGPKRRQGTGPVVNDYMAWCANQWKRTCLTDKGIKNEDGSIYKIEPSPTAFVERAEKDPRFRRQAEDKLRKCQEAKIAQNADCEDFLAANEPFTDEHLMQMCCDGMQHRDADHSERNIPRSMRMVRNAGKTKVVSNLSEGAESSPPIRSHPGFSETAAIAKSQAVETRTEDFLKERRAQAVAFKAQARQARLSETAGSTSASSGVQASARQARLEPSRSPGPEIEEPPLDVRESPPPSPPVNIFGDTLDIASLTGDARYDPIYGKGEGKGKPKGIGTGKGKSHSKGPAKGKGKERGKSHSKTRSDSRRPQDASRREDRSRDRRRDDDPRPRDQRDARPDPSGRDPLPRRLTTRNPPVWRPVVSPMPSQEEDRGEEARR